VIHKDSINDIKVSIK